MADAAARAARGDEPVPTQDVADRRAAREGPPRVPPLEERPQLLAAPDGVPMASLQDRGHDLVGGLIRGAMGTARALLQAGGPEAQVAVDPFVARLAGDAIAIAELRDRLGLTQVVGDELRALIRGCGIPPRHGHLLRYPPVWCHPCPWTKVLPMSPDRTPQQPNRGMQPTRRRERLMLTVRRFHL
jgi:hypothetical protein